MVMRAHRGRAWRAMYSGPRPLYASRSTDGASLLADRAGSTLAKPFPDGPVLWPGAGRWAQLTHGIALPVSPDCLTTTQVTRFALR